MPRPLVPGDAVVSVLAQRDGLPGASVPEKPTVETTPAFLAELESFWDEEDSAVDVTPAEGLHSDTFWGDIDQMLNDFDEAAKGEEQQHQLQAEVATGVGISLTAGFVSWALRAGSMAASFLAAMPTWRNFDPVPILTEEDKLREATVSDQDGDDASDTPGGKEKEAEVEELFDR